MKRLLILAGLLFLGLSLAGRQDSQTVSVVNVEVPVRVFRGDAFVDNLTLDDFEVLEDGVPQRVEAVYLIRKESVERKEESKPFVPDTSRSFHLFFELLEYHPKIKEAVDFFVQNVLGPRDHLVLVTPVKAYELRKEALAGVPKEKIAERINELLRRDILIGNSAYRRVLDDLKRLVATKDSARATIDPEQESMGSGSLEEFFMQYRSYLERLENLRVIDEATLLNYAGYLKKQEGQKFVFLFYQREFIPVMDRKQQMELFGEDVLTDGALAELFDFYKRNISFNVDRIKKAYAEASITINFLLLSPPADDIPSTQKVEHSEDVFLPLMEMTKATGGIAASSSNAAAMMRTASEASENYYLLYYTPKDKTASDRFREIRVRVKTEGCRVTHRAGYFLR
jgi:hypothetical protein